MLLQLRRLSGRMAPMGCRFNSAKIPPTSTESLEIAARIAELTDSLKRYSDMYYSGTSLVSDTEYDSLFEELSSLEARFPSLRLPTSPTQTVGTGTVSVKAVKHSQPMLSLRSVMRITDVTEFLRQTVPGSWTVEHKLDGMAIALRYDRNGRFIRALSRGDGAQGDDISAGVRRTVRNLPSKVDNLLGIAFEIRGEAVIPKSTSSSYAEGASLRNLAVGLLRRTVNISVTSEKAPIDVICYSVHALEGDDNQLDSEHHSRLRQLETMGFTIDPELMMMDDPRAVLRCIQRGKRNRGLYPYECDGFVIKLNSITEQQRLSSTARAPRWAIAYKYDAKRAVSVLDSVEFSVGRTGKVTPVAIIKPVRIGNVVVSRATLHNMRHFRSFGPLRVGDRVEVQRSGDVIPHIVTVTPDNNSSSNSKLHLELDPSHQSLCPCDRKSILREQADEPDMWCVDPECEAVRIGRLSHAVSKSALDIRGFGVASVKQLIASGLVRDFCDLFSLNIRESELNQLPGWESLKTKNCLQAIELARQNASPVQVLVSFGIDGVGREVSNALLSHFKTVERVLAASFDDIVLVRGAGSTIAQAIVDFAASGRGQSLINRMVKASVRGMASEAESLEHLSASQGPLSGMTFVLSGTFGQPKANLITRLRSVGAQTSDRVTSSIHFVVLGSKSKRQTKKATDAKRLNIDILTEEDLLQRLPK